MSGRARKTEVFRDPAERVTRSHGDEKPEPLRNAFVNGTTVEDSRGPLKEVMLRVAGELTADHMRVLRVVKEREDSFTEADRKSNSEFIAWGHLAAAGLPQDTVIPLCQNLIGVGALANWWGNRIGAPLTDTDRYRLTHPGRQPMRFISAPSGPAHGGG
jgi:hypothetical protein